ncbi:E3 SUMO-protein ligase PIAS2 [Orchesella cincta]|uniref:E3 SUMO-protein ligase PIAS2 n=1 Tax=Orchesella cincta TaxID=48709 RepID=A0A1D2M8U6_ORCCI|nr:E3 SUMO-protein ligase PIAS2 [Orchesella cincta]
MLEQEQMIKRMQLCDLKNLLKAANISFKPNQRKALLQKKCLESPSLRLLPDLVKEHYENYIRRRQALIIKRQRTSRGSETSSSESSFTENPEPELQQEEAPTLSKENALPATSTESAATSATFVNTNISAEVDSRSPSLHESVTQQGKVADKVEKESLQIQFRKSPFYEVQAVLLPPKVLVSSAAVQASPTELQSFYNFTLTPEQTEEYSRGETEIQLRFCKNDPFTVQDDRLPQNLEVTVNTKVIYKTPKFDDSFPLNELSKSPSAPLVITNVNTAGALRNCVHVLWGCNNTARSFVLAIFLVKKVTTEALVQQLERLTRHDTLKLIKAVGDDLNAAGPKTISVKLSVSCPIGMQRITLPIRSKTCSHVQCFDAKTFLAMWEIKPYSQARCPVCKDDLNFDDLRIDGYFAHVLTELSPRVGNVIEVTLEDGSWSACETVCSSSSTHSRKARASSTSRSAGGKSPVLIDLVLTPFSAANQNQHGSENPETVDLLD